MMVSDTRLRWTRHRFAEPYGDHAAKARGLLVDAHEPPPQR
ncbi:hypothetical protein [Actinomadura graeca]|nr:hypothetical protein [Actinomadura graeca]